MTEIRVSISTSYYSVINISIIQPFTVLLAGIGTIRTNRRLFTI
ncbi:MAG: hypothetical protein QS748_01320 [Candidatus Endonucleobacter bathymodioli]|uniref:Uncharacterized protein n=1 Tax=Candidatus Endonucleibacter bathymodioli TaxID=539814 RepID=A0AA90SWQ1_9GAMM|nr:hypothetical protein [Candidatus Endonucleobacter bathymodioli]